MDLQLEGRLALVTGASQGIGAAIAQTLAEEGCDVVLVGRSLENLEIRAAAISQSTGRRISIEAADISRPDGVEIVAANWGHADILVNNAGAIPGGRIDEVNDTAWRDAWDLKVFGYINLIRLIFPKMAERKHGTIVNVIGAAAQIRDPSYICGVAGNAALAALTMSLGSDSHHSGIRVVGVNPGPVATARLLKLQESVPSSTARPFGRPADPEEIAAAVAFLASPKSGYTTGTVLTIDGGISARAAA